MPVKECMKDIKQFELLSLEALVTDINIIAHTAITRQEASIHVMHIVLVQERLTKAVLYLNNVIA